MHTCILDTYSPTEATVMCCEFNHNGTLMAAGLSNGSVKVSNHSN
jgi:hypothetical protein